MVPATAFDPRHGYDAFRYGATLADVAVWSATLRRYGFTEADATRYVRDNVRQGLRTVAVGCDTVSALDVVIYEMKDRAATMLKPQTSDSQRAACFARTGRTCVRGGRRPRARSRTRPWGTRRAVCDGRG